MKTSSAEMPVGIVCRGDRRARRRLLAAAGCLLAGGYLAGCLLGVSYEKVDGACAEPTPAACDGGASYQLNGSGEVEVTDMAAVDQGGVVLVGRFTGVLSPQSGPQLDAGAGTMGFLLELDSAGDYVAHLLLPEVDAESEPRVAVDADSGQVAVAGKYRAATGGGCTFEAGIFVRRVSFSKGSGYTTAFGNGAEVVCIGGNAATDIEVNDVGIYPEDLYVHVAGSFNGKLAGQQSQGVDGFGVSVDPMGVASPIFRLAGSGDATVVATMPSHPNHEWLLFGHFSGLMEVGVGDIADNHTATKGNDLFLISYDDNSDDPNLSVTIMPTAGGAHQALGLAYDPSMPDVAVLLAQLDDGVNIAGNEINADGGRAALALLFQVPVDTTHAAFDALGDHVLRAPQLAPRFIAGNGNSFYVAGEAAGDVVVEHDGARIGSIPASGCQRDAFVVRLSGSDSIAAPSRCGDGQQQLSALTDGPGATVVMAITVPAGGALGDTTVETGRDAFVLYR